MARKQVMNGSGTRDRGCNRGFSHGRSANLGKKEDKGLSIRESLEASVT